MINDNIVMLPNPILLAVISTIVAIYNDNSCSIIIAMYVYTAQYRFCGQFRLQTEIISSLIRFDQLIALDVNHYDSTSLAAPSPERSA